MIDANAVNGEEVTADQNIYSYFVDLAGKKVKLLVHKEPPANGVREIIVEPLTGESNLRYYDWPERNRRYVDQSRSEERIR